MKKIKSIHLVGVKGVGMTPLAIIAKEAGISVTGSDIEEEFITDEPLIKAGIRPMVGFAPDDIGSPDLVIVTGAHGGFDNPQVKKAVAENIPVWTQGQAVGEFMNGKIFEKKISGISVSGTHGKTTTTAIIATILSQSNLDPSYVIGTSQIPSLGLPGHLGKGKYFIAEADEYATEPEYDKTPKFMWQNPEIIVITNIELDHLDLYGNVGQLRKDFLKFAKKVESKGRLIICGDDGENRKLIKDYKGEVTTYGFSPSNDIVIEKISQIASGTFFFVGSKGTSLGEFYLNLPGQFNALNALAGISAGIEIGLPIDKIKNSLSKYKGAKRRFEYIGKLSSGALLFDDYAHHPTEIKKTLKAFHDSFNNKKIVCIFQPHTFSRTKTLFEDFVNSFSNADTVLIADIYPSLREKIDDSVSSEFLVRKMSTLHNSVMYLSDIPSVVKYISEKNFGQDYIIVSMGAGDIYKIQENLEFEKD